MAITANITVSFGADGASAGSHLSAEIDDRTEGLNAGETSFSPGDQAGFLVYQSSNVTHDAPVPSAGAVSSVGAVTVEREEDVSFANEDTASLGVPAAGITSVTWFGNALGGLTLQPDGMTVKASAKGVAVARVTYTAPATGYKLASPATLAGETDYSIVVFILGHEIPSP
jgi:hypothetical protein